MAEIIIVNGTVLTLDSERRIIRDGAVVIERDRIVEVGKTDSLQQRFQADKVIDARNRIVMPGMIDSHVHPVQMLIMWP